MSSYYECKMQRSRVHEKIETVVSAFLEKELKDFSYLETSVFIEDNKKKIENIIPEVVACYEHDLDNIFFSKNVRYCALFPKSSDNFTFLRQSVYRHFNIEELNTKKRNESGVDCNRKNKASWLKLVKRASERIRGFIYEDLEKTIVVNKNPVTGKKYSLRDALIFIEESEHEIENFIADFLENQVKKGEFFRIFNDDTIHLELSKELSESSIYTNLDSHKEKKASPFSAQKKISGTRRIVDILVK